MRGVLAQPPLRFGDVDRWQRAGWVIGALLGMGGGPSVGPSGWAARSASRASMAPISSVDVQPGRHRPAARRSSASTRRARAPVRFRAIPAGLPRTAWT